MAVLGLTSCEKEPSKAIVGTWEAERMEMALGGINMEIDLSEQGMKMEFTFNADGTGSVFMEAEGSSERTTFEYSVNGNLLSLTEEGETTGIPISFDKKTMVMEMDGATLGEEGVNIKVYFVKK